MRGRSRWTECFAILCASTIATTSSCADDVEPVVAGTSIERSAASTTTTVSTAAVPDEPIAFSDPTTTTVQVGLLPPEQVERSAVGPPRDWEGQRYDLGTIRQARMAGADRSLIFDRKQLRGQDGELRSGATFTEEPIVVTERAESIVNTSRGLRTYTVAPDVRVRQLDPAWSCAPDGPAAPAWHDVPYESLVIFGAGDDDIDSLVFDDAGHVVQIRLSRHC